MFCKLETEAVSIARLEQVAFFECDKLSKPDTQYGSSSTCYWVSMVAPVLDTGQKSCARTCISHVQEQAEVLCKNMHKSCARTGRSPVHEQADRLCVAMLKKSYVYMSYQLRVDSYRLLCRTSLSDFRTSVDGEIPSPYD
ncbi:hypothetical protein E3N88_26594 [Mikania micrantha]|uniref:Uncharacterized protein n=1 Tax=Mikania micrantha TaxID=192012 RepID=A0A5N6MU74_9ASTR|nr:hypothetical protein E3N88_26594 [Mikania micrantha]